MKKLLLFVALASVASVAVADAYKPAEAAASPHGGMLTKPGVALSPGHPQALSADIPLTNNGKVLEVLDSDMYTFLKVTSEKGPVWLAAYKTKVSKGADVKYSDGIAMTKFYSKSLKRTFDLIIFVDRLKLAK